jgi:hypothetical protein
MSKISDRILKTLEALKLPALQARYAKATGKTSRSPNRKFLLREILEAEKKAKAIAAAAMKRQRQAAAAGPGRVQMPAATTSETERGAEETQYVRGQYSKFTVAELQAEYLRVVGRPTGSDDRGYLLWKLRVALQGKIRCGPRRTRVGVECKTIPIRIEAQLLTEMDEAWLELGFPSRNQFVIEATTFFAGHCRSIRAST